MEKTHSYRIKCIDIISGLGDRWRVGSIPAPTRRDWEKAKENNVNFEAAIATWTPEHDYHRPLILHWKQVKEDALAKRNLLVPTFGADGWDHVRLDNVAIAPRWQAVMRAAESRRAKRHNARLDSDFGLPAIDRRITLREPGHFLRRQGKIDHGLLLWAHRTAGVNMHSNLVRLGSPSALRLAGRNA